MTGHLSGSVSANYSSSTDSNGNTTYSFVNAAGNVGIDVPTIPVSALASTAPQYWSCPQTWNGAPILLANDAIAIAGALADGVGAFLDIPATADTLINSGPTEQSVALPFLHLESHLVPGVNASLSASANLTYNVTLPTGTDVLMDQPTVAVHSLYVEPGATLTGNGSFTVRTDLTNQGTLYNLGGTIQGTFSNRNGMVGAAAAYADVTAPTTIAGSFANNGTISVESSGYLSLAPNPVNDGAINVYGSLYAPGTLTNSATVNWYAGSMPVVLNSLTGTLNVAGAGAKSLTNFGLALDNAGTVTQAGGSTVTFNGFPGGSGWAATPAVLNNRAGAVYDLRGDGPAMTAEYGGYANQFRAGLVTNAGTFRKSAGTGTATVGVVFQNTGSVEVDAGTLEFDGGFTTSGTTTVTAAATLAVSGTLVQTADGTFSAAGTFRGGGFANAGTATFAGPQQWANNSTFTNTVGSATFGTDAGSAAASPLTVVANGGTVMFTCSQHLAGLSLSTGALAVEAISADGRMLLITAALSIASSAGAWTGRLDVGNNGLVFVNGSLPILTSQVAQGFAGGTWNGSGGITSSAAAADARHLTAIGVIQNVEPGGAAVYTSFDGQPVSASDILARYTYYGDTNLDGVVNGADYSRIDAAFIGHLTGWANGDFNYDGVVDGSDYTLMDDAFNQQFGGVAAAASLVASSTAELTGGGAAAVPEPAGLAVVGLVAMLGRRRRR